MWSFFFLCVADHILINLWFMFLPLINCSQRAYKWWEDKYTGIMTTWECNLSRNWVGWFHCILRFWRHFGHGTQLLKFLCHCIRYWGTKTAETKKTVWGIHFTNYLDNCTVLTIEQNKIKTSRTYMTYVGAWFILDIKNVFYFLSFIDPILLSSHSLLYKGMQWVSGPYKKN